jgi:uncharacterized membrane protein SpoIIM required for sporulation|tara:strand:- start:14445 stop:15272 length:828 start_codon:yes stop_codon:yes gene_type:complete
MLEQLFPASWIERKSWFAFILGASYAVFGIGSALLLFPKEPGLAAVAFTSLLALPSLNKMLSLEEKQAAREKKFDLTDPFKNHKDVFSVYIFLFIGVFLAFSLTSIILPSITTNNIFAEQVNAVGLTGSAAGQGNFTSIFSNNLIVFLFALVASFVYGSGAIFIIIWNASVWGVVFGVIARDATTIANYSPGVYFTLMIIAVAPHMITEASAYIMAAISGGIVSKAVIFEKSFSKRFKKILQDAYVIFFIAIILLVIAAYIETNITRNLFRLVGL